VLSASSSKLPPVNRRPTPRSAGLRLRFLSPFTFKSGLEIAVIPADFRLRIARGWERPMVENIGAMVNHARGKARHGGAGAALG